MDDLVTTHKNVDEAYCLFVKARERMSYGGFKLRKWKTNDQSLAHSIAIKEGAVKNKHKIEGQLIEKPNEINAKTKVVGLTCDKDQDSVELDLYKIIECTNCVTKRSILSTATAVF